jgi:hypothetical protein
MTIGRLQARRPFDGIVWRSASFGKRSKIELSSKLSFDEMSWLPDDKRSSSKNPLGTGTRIPEIFESR